MSEDKYWLCQCRLLLCPSQIHANSQQSNPINSIPPLVSLYPCNLFSHTLINSVFNYFVINLLSGAIYIHGVADQQIFRMKSEHWGKISD